MGGLLLLLLMPRRVRLFCRPLLLRLWLRLLLVRWLSVRFHASLVNESEEEYPVCSAAAEAAAAFEEDSCDDDDDARGLLSPADREADLPCATRTRRPPVLERRKLSELLFRIVPPSLLILLPGPRTLPPQPPQPSLPPLALLLLPVPFPPTLLLRPRLKAETVMLAFFMSAGTENLPFSSSLPPLPSSPPSPPLPSSLLLLRSEI
jgi:hypothetical protein